MFINCRTTILINIINISSNKKTGSVQATTIQNPFVPILTKSIVKIFTITIQTMMMIVWHIG